MMAMIFACIEQSYYFDNAVFINIKGGFKLGSLKVPSIRKSVIDTSWRECS